MAISNTFFFAYDFAHFFFARMRRNKKNMAYKVGGCIYLFFKKKTEVSIINTFGDMNFAKN